MNLLPRWREHETSPARCKPGATFIPLFLNCCNQLLQPGLSPSRGDPDGLKVFLGCVRRFQLRARLGRPWHHREVSSLTDPTVQISRSGFLKQDSPGTPRNAESEAAAEDADEGVQYISPTSAGSLACGD